MYLGGVRQVHFVAFWWSFRRHYWQGNSETGLLSMDDGLIFRQNYKKKKISIRLAISSFFFDLSPTQGSEFRVIYLNLINGSIWFVKMDIWTNWWFIFALFDSIRQTKKTSFKDNFFFQLTDIPLIWIMYVLFFFVLVKNLSSHALSDRSSKFRRDIFLLTKF